MQDRRIEAVVAIIRHADRYLIVKRSDHVGSAHGYWCPVSGHLQEYETQAEAVQREVMEEVGLEVTAIKKVCELPSADGRYLLHYWTTEVLGGEARIVSNEAVEIKWVTLQEMKELQPVFAEDIQIIEKFCS
jgi:8-oxo-dGTP diphosphatase